MSIKVTIETTVEAVNRVEATVAYVEKLCLASKSLEDPNRTQLLEDILSKLQPAWLLMKRDTP